MVNFKLTLVFAVLCMLTACASQQAVDENTKRQSWSTHQALVQNFTSWELNGRVSIQVEKEAWSAALQWHQDAQEYYLRLTAPLGRGTYEIYGNNETVFLRTGKDEVRQANDPKTLMDENLGWHVPIDGLFYWIRGLPDSRNEIEKISLNEKGQLIELSQSGWQLNYERYAEFAGYHLPGRISLENDRLKMRLVIRRWDS